MHKQDDHHHLLGADPHEHEEEHLELQTIVSPPAPVSRAEDQRAIDKKDFEPIKVNLVLDPNEQMNEMEMRGNSKTLQKEKLPAYQKLKGQRHHYDPKSLTGKDVEQEEVTFFGDEIQLIPHDEAFFDDIVYQEDTVIPGEELHPHPRVLLIDYTATERTESAWLRTCLSLIGFGLTLGKMFHKKREDISLVFILLAAMYFILCYVHFRREAYILRDKKSILLNTWMIGCCSLFTLAAYVVLMVFLRL